MRKSIDSAKELNEANLLTRRYADFSDLLLKMGDLAKSQEVIQQAYALDPHREIITRRIKSLNLNRTKLRDLTPVIRQNQKYQEYDEKCRKIFGKSIEEFKTDKRQGISNLNRTLGKFSNLYKESEIVKEEMIEYLENSGIPMKWLDKSKIENEDVYEWIDCTVQLNKYAQICKNELGISISEFIKQKFENKFIPTPLYIKKICDLVDQELRKKNE